MKQVTELNILTLAYLGDAIYEIYIREFLIKKGIVKVNELQKESIRFVSANSQCDMVKNLLADNFFKEEEVVIINRGRNHKGSRHPKNADIVTYKYATGFEALIGYLYLGGNRLRIDEIMQKVIGD